MIYEDPRPFEEVDISFQSGPKGDPATADEDLLKEDVSDYLTNHPSLLNSEWIHDNLDEWMDQTSQHFGETDNSIFSNGNLGQGYAEVVSVSSVENRIVVNASMEDNYVIPYYGGGLVLVKFGLDSMEQQPAGIYLDINETGALPVLYRGEFIGADYIKPGDIAIFTVGISFNPSGEFPNSYILLGTDSLSHLTKHSQSRPIDVTVPYINSNGENDQKTISVHSRQLIFSDNDVGEFMDASAVNDLAGEFAVLDENKKLPSAYLPQASTSKAGFSKKPVISTEVVRFTTDSIISANGAISGYFTVPADDSKTLIGMNLQSTPFNYVHVYELFPSNHYNNQLTIGYGIANTLGTTIGAGLNIDIKLIWITL